MKRLTLPLLLLASLLCVPFCVDTAHAVGLRQVIQTLEVPFQTGTSADQAILDVQGEFFQESRIASLDRVQRGRGRVAFRFDRSRSDRAPLAMFRWEYDQPSSQEFVSDGRSMWVYLPENNQVILTNIEQTAQARPQDPLTFLTGLGNLSRDFSIGWASPNQDVEGNYVLRLQPRRPSSLIRELLIVVDREAARQYAESGTTGRRFPILSSTVIDPNDNTTLIEFSDLRVNRGLSALDFEFILPPGVDVVRPTGQEMGF